MTLRNNKAITTSLITVLPLFIAVGCASNSDKLAETEATPLTDNTTHIEIDLTPDKTQAPTTPEQTAQAA